MNTPLQLSHHLRVLQRYAPLVPLLLVLIGSCSPGEPLEGGLPDGGSLVGVHLEPETAGLHPAETQDFSAVAEFSNGATNPVSATWVAEGGSITSDGRYAAGAIPGSYLVIGTLPNGLADTSVVIISPSPAETPVLFRVQINPDNVSLLPSSSQQFTAVGILTDSSETAVSVSWRATAGTISSTGLASAPSNSGSYLVIATMAGGMADTARVVVADQPATLIGVQLTPVTATVEAGLSTQFNAVGLLATGGTTPISVTWSVTGGTISSSGLYRAGSTAGTFRVIAAAAGVADTSAVIITAPTVSSINLTPSTVSVTSGQTKQFAVTALLSNGATQNNPAVTWTATGGTISNSGLYTAGGTAGAFRVIATSANGKSDTSAVTVVIPSIVSLSLTPQAVSVDVGSTQQVTVSATLSTGETVASPAVTWVATGGTVDGNGIYTAGTVPGLYAVTATCACGLVAASDVTVALAPPPPSGPRPNEPAGYVTITDQSMSSATADGWRIDDGNPTVTTDATAPVSPSGVIRATYPAGTRAGGAPWTIERPLPGTTRLYYALSFKQSSNFQGESSGTNKLGFVWIHDNPSIFMSTEGVGSGSLEAIMRLQGVADSRDHLDPNKGKSAVVARGRWHLWEAELISNTGGLANGTVRWWLDGVLIGEYTDVRMSTASQSRTFELTSIFPIWGGTNSTVSSTMTIDFDHYYVSGRD